MTYKSIWKSTSQNLTHIHDTDFRKIEIEEILNKQRTSTNNLQLTSYLKKKN